MPDIYKEFLTTTTYTHDDLGVGSVELVATDASTQKVIKEVRVKSFDNKYFSAIPADLNGWSVGDFAASMSGDPHLIMHESQSLSIDTGYDRTVHDAEPKYASITYIEHDDNEDLVEFTISTRAGKESLVQRTVLVAGGLQDWKSASYITNNGVGRDYMQVGAAYYCLCIESNSVQYIWYWATATTAPVRLNSDSYHPAVIDPVEGAAYWFTAATSGTLWKHTPAGGTTSIRTSVPNDNFSTYSRWYMIDSWIFYTQNNSSPNWHTNLEAVNVTTGAHVAIGGLYNMQSMSGGDQLWVTKDTALDRYVVYKTHCQYSPAYSMYRSVLSLTISTMNAYGTNTNNSSSGTHTSSNISHWQSQFSSITAYIGTNDSNWNELRYLPHATDPYSFWMVVTQNTGNGTDANYGVNRVALMEFDDHTDTSKTPTYSEPMRWFDATYGNRNAVSGSSICYFNHYPFCANGATTFYVPDAAEIAATTYASGNAVTIQIEGIEVT
jgi:hypothetical protein